MKRLFVVSLLFAAAGCASSQPPSAEYTPKPQSEADQAIQTRARLHVDLAAGYYSLGNQAVALQEVNEALKVDPNYPKAYAVLGAIYAALNDTRRAEENFQQSLHLDPTDPDTNDGYGLFLCQHKREGEGLKYFEAALRNPLYRTPEKSLVNAGVCADQAGDMAAAEGYFQKALMANPSQPQSLFHMAEIAYRRGNFSDAKGYLLRLPSDVAPNAKLLWLELRIERNLGNQSAAASYAFQLRKNFPESPEAQALRAGRYK